MSERIFPALIAIPAGILLLVLLFVPLIMSSYRKYGRFTTGRMLIWAAGVIYAAGIMSYTLIPLPDSFDFTCRAPQLQLFAFVSDIQKYGVGSVSAIAHNPAVLQFAFNILLLLPLGFFMRWLWGRGVMVTTLVGFGISMLIEVTQLTGIFGLYPCAYRFFDVDDLLANTIGAALGGVLALIFRLRKVGKPEPGPRRVTFGRRLLGMVCDVLAAWLIGYGSAIAVNLASLLTEGTEFHFAVDPAVSTLLASAVPLAIEALVTLISGRTIGDFAVNLRYQRGAIPEFPARVLRLVGGIGGYLVISLFDGLVPWASWLSLAFVIAVIVAAIATRDRRGLAGILSGQTLRDAFDRADAPPTAA